MPYIIPCLPYMLWRLLNWRFSHGCDLTILYHPYCFYFVSHTYIKSWSLNLLFLPDVMLIGSYIVLIYPLTGFHDSDSLEPSLSKSVYLSLFRIQIYIKYKRPYLQRMSV